MARSASSTVIRSPSPSTRPLAVSRITAHQAVKSGASGVTGASEWMAKGMPRRETVPQASIRCARASPMVCATCSSPQ